MIKILSFKNLPIPEQRIGQVYAIEPIPMWLKDEPHISPLPILWPPPAALKNLRRGYYAGDIRRYIAEPHINLELKPPRRSTTWHEFEAKYRQALTNRWPAVKAWLNSLTPRDELYLVTFGEGKDHRILVARMIRKHRPDIKIRCT